MAKKESSEAAKKIAKAEKEKISRKSNKPNFFVRAGKAIKSFLKNSKGDLKKIVWPAAKEILKGTVVTIVCIAIVGVLVFVVDLGLTKGIQGLRTAAENRTAVTTTVEDTTAEETTKAEETTADTTAAETTSATAAQ